MNGVVVDCLLGGALALPLVVGVVVAGVAFARAARDLVRMRRLTRAATTRLAAIVGGEARGRVVVRGRARASAGTTGGARAGLLVDEWGRLPPLDFAVDDGSGMVAVERGEALFDDLLPRGRVLWEDDELVLEAEVVRVEATYRLAPSVTLRPTGGRAMVVGRDDRWWGPLGVAGARVVAWTVVAVLGELVLGGFVFAILSAVG